MKSFFLLLVCFVGSLGFSQKQYHFDYALIYDNGITFNRGLISNLFLINSNDNSHHTFVSFDKDSIVASLQLVDFNGLVVNSNMRKEMFYKGQTFTNSCNSVIRFSNRFKDKANDYDFVKHQDTIINDTVYFHYSIKSNKSLAYQKRKEIVTSHYIIDKNSEQFEPFLFRTTEYNKWIKVFKLPKGLIKIKYDVNVEGEIIFKQELIKVIQINKFFTIPDECDYTKSPK